MNFDHLLLRPRSAAARLRLVQRELGILGLPLVVGTTSQGDQCFGGLAKFGDNITAIAARDPEGYRLQLMPSPDAVVRANMSSILGGAFDDGHGSEWTIRDPSLLAQVNRALIASFGMPEAMTALSDGVLFRVGDSLGNTRQRGILHCGMSFDFNFKAARTFDYKFCPMCGEDLEERVVEQPDVKRHACTRCDWIHWDPPKVVSIVIVRDKERKGVWLIRRNNTQVGKIAFAGGFLMRNEGIFIGGKREGWEETGFVIFIDGFFWETPVPGKNEILVFMLGTVESGEPTTSSETSEVLFLTNEQLAAQPLAYPLHDQAKAMYLAAVA